jgi:hypothetical protein
LSGLQQLYIDVDNGKCIFYIRFIHSWNDLFWRTNTFTQWIIIVKCSIVFVRINASFFYFILEHIFARPQVKEGDRIRHSYCRIPFDLNSTKPDEIRVGSGRISLRSVEFWWNPDQIPIEKNPTKTVSDPIGFFMKDVGFRWNPTRIRSKTIGSTGLFTCPGFQHVQTKISKCFIISNHRYQVEIFFYF